MGKRRLEPSGYAAEKKDRVTVDCKNCRFRFVMLVPRSTKEFVAACYWCDEAVTSSDVFSRIPDYEIPKLVG